jgi:hypothetical protein
MSLKQFKLWYLDNNKKKQYLVPRAIRYVPGEDVAKACVFEGEVENILWLLEKNHSYVNLNVEMFGASNV